MNERSSEMRKRLEKKMRKSTKNKEIDQDAIDEEMARMLPAIHSPELSDILPIKLAHFLVDHQFFIVSLKSSLYRLLNGWRRQSTTDDEITSADQTEPVPLPKKTRVVRIADIVPEMATSQTVPVVSYTFPIVASSDETTNQTSESRNFNRPWSEEDKQLLCKTIIRFPPGTPRRWEKIADAIGRHVSQVTEMAKQIQSAVGTGPQENHSSFSTATKIDQNLITEREQPDPVSDWSRTDQQLLECALKNIAKDAPGIDRWEQIARCVPGKTREECLARYRFIAQRVRAKKVV